MANEITSKKKIEKLDWRYNRNRSLNNVVDKLNEIIDKVNEL